MTSSYEAVSLCITVASGDEKTLAIMDTFTVAIKTKLSIIQSKNLTLTNIKTRRSLFQFYFIRFY